jgi:hypothetical protein
MGTTVLLSQLSATTELLVINLVTQQHPEPDPQLASRMVFMSEGKRVSESYFDSRISRPLVDWMGRAFIR